MSETIILNDEEEADKLFNAALKDCLEIRRQRRELYGNSWLQQDGVEANFWGGVINKTNRLKILHSNRDKENGYENYNEVLRDLVVLTLFTMASAKYERKQIDEGTVDLGFIPDTNNDR